MMKRILLGSLGLYRSWVSPGLRVLSPIGCKFHPTCSQYAAEAIEMHGAAKGGRMALQRLIRCHPFSRGGFDPVPMAENPAAPIGLPHGPKPMDRFASVGTKEVAPRCKTVARLDKQASRDGTLAVLHKPAVPSVTIKVSRVDPARASLNDGRAGQARRNPVQNDRTRPIG